MIHCSSLITNALDYKTLPYSQYPIMRLNAAVTFFFFFFFFFLLFTFLEKSLCPPPPTFRRRATPLHTVTGQKNNSSTGVGACVLILVDLLSNIQISGYVYWRGPNYRKEFAVFWLFCNQNQEKHRKKNTRRFKVNSSSIRQYTFCLEIQSINWGNPASVWPLLLLYLKLSANIALYYRKQCFYERKA